MPRLQSIYASYVGKFNGERGYQRLWQMKEIE